MKLIFISGPSGSGKTTLSKQIIGKIKNGHILNTDNYYRIGILSKLLSKFVKGYFDRSISFNYKLFNKDFNFIIKNGISIYARSYNFEKKTINNSLKETSNINFLIIEGIFAKEFSSTLYNQNYFFLELKINKNECKKRVVQRDLKERGKEKKQAEEDFLKSWDIYYEKFNNKKIKKNATEFTITEKTNINQILNKLFGWVFNFPSKIKVVKIDPSILPNTHPSKQSPHNQILYFLINFKDNVTAKAEGWEALNFMIEIPSLTS